MPFKINIAIDGPSGCGKSTLARALARALQYLHIDSGAMFRAMAFYGQQEQIVVSDKVKLAILKTLPFCFKWVAAYQKHCIFLGDRNLEPFIRGEEVAQQASVWATDATVRAAALHLQRSWAKNGGVVMDGRDIATVVLPQAALKIFLTASPEIRAHRRYIELKDKGMRVSEADILAQLCARDEQDTQRVLAPLRVSAEAVVLDTSVWDERQVFEKAYALAEACLKNKV